MEDERERCPSSANGQVLFDKLERRCHPGERRPLAKEQPAQRQNLFFVFTGREAF